MKAKLVNATRAARQIAAPTSCAFAAGAKSTLLTSACSIHPFVPVAFPRSTVVGLATVVHAPHLAE